MTIIPSVKHCSTNKKSFILPPIMAVYVPKQLSIIKGILDDVFPWRESLLETADCIFVNDRSVPEEGYILEIEESRIMIRYREYAGCVHALMTLKQMVDNDRIPIGSVTDYPDLKIRGLLLDISRDKIPTMTTLKQIADLMMLVKMNHLELYVEGFPIFLPSFPDLPYETPITKVELKEFEAYCLMRAIELVPNVNTFGHMTKWLQLDRFHHLAECESGYINHGYPFPASTLNPLEEESIKLVKKIILDMADGSSSEFFNLNGDEPFELSLGKSKVATDKKGVGNVYLEYMEKHFQTVRDIDKTPMIWGDVLANHMELLPDFPKDVVVIDWGYDASHDFDTPAKAYHDNKIPFLLAPGTSSWNSFASRLSDMIKTTDNSVLAANTFRGLGVLMTDWGDFGHPQSIIFSYPGIVYAAKETWTKSGDFTNVVSWMDEQIFAKVPSKLAKRIVDLAGYYQLEDVYVSNSTMIFSSWMFSDPDPNHPLPFKFQIWKSALSQYPISLEAADKIYALLEMTKSGLENESLLEAREIIQTVNLIDLCMSMNLMINRQKNQLERLIKLTETIKTGYKNIWLERNQSGGLKSAMSRLEVLQAFLHNWEKL